jgi:hypothetical protein
MRPEAYAAARTVSPMLHAYFACHREKALSRGGGHLAPLPDAQTIETIIDAAFWASLRREEGHITRISLALVAPEDAQAPILFERPLPLDPGALTRVAPAVERPGIHLGVWRHEGELGIWGATRGIPFLCFVLEVTAPGLLVVKHHNGSETRKFINVAVLEGDRIKMVDQRISERSDSPQLLRSLLQFDSSVPGLQSVITIVRLSISMREHGRGGTLLIVPADTESWRASILQPMPYAVSPPFGQLADLDQASAGAAIAAIGGLTAVDGATVLTSRYELLGFGAKIVRQGGSRHIDQVLLSEPIHGAAPVLVHPDQIGGTRHLSAAQFVQDQQDAVALVASQDGRFTVFEWSPTDAMAHAYRVETLLL